MKLTTTNKYIGLLIILIIGFSNFSCKQTQKAINIGDYDYAIERSVAKLRKNKKKSKVISELEVAYNRAQRQDLKRIQDLKATGNPANYFKIFQTYANMDDRQDRVAPLLPLYNKKEHKNANIEIKSIYKELESFRNKSAEYLHARANILLNSGDKQDAREAYTMLKRIDSFFPGFKNTRNLLSEANSIGSNYILFELKNATGVPMPPNFEREISKISLSELDQTWAEFHSQREKNINYDYVVKMNIVDVDVSPERIAETIFTREKEIKDGWQYALDKRGNVMKDSLGNDIKVDIIRRIRCDVSEFTQEKNAIIHASIDFIDSNGQRIGHYPVNAGAGFDHRYGQPRGDVRALKSKDERLCNQKPVPFPADMDLLMQAGINLKPAVKNIIFKNDELVIN